MDAPDNSFPLSPDDRDIAIRTMLGEEGDPSALAGVASTMINRARAGTYGGSTLRKVALAPGQFEPWSARSKDLLAISPNDPKYIQAGNILDGVASGDIPDPTNGATHFYAPGAQSALGRNAPAWAKGKGVALGKTLFFSPNGSPKAPASAAIDKATIDPFSEFPTTAAASAKAVPTVDPFSEYPTSAKPAGGGLKASISETPANADPFTEYHTSPTTIEPTARMAGAQPGPMGLVWNAAGGFDPKSGELVIAGKPPQEAASSQGRAAAAGFLNGIPIAGPTIQGAAEKAGAGIRNLLTGDPYEQTLSHAQNADAASMAAYPKTALASGIGGAVVGTAPAMLAAPAAFGAGEGGLLINALTGGATGGAIGAADNVARNGLSVDNAKQGAFYGALGGVAGPVAGKFVGSSVGAASNLLNRTTPGAANVANIFRDIGATPQGAASDLAKIGPNAIIADLDPALTTEAGGLASLGGAPTSILKTAMATRAAQADNRVSQAIDTALGPKPDLTAAKEGIVDQARQAAGPLYQAAFARGKSMNVTPVLNEIDAQSKNAVGGVAAVLAKAKSYLTDQKVGLPGPNGQPTSMIVPKSDPQALLSVRQALDDTIESLQRTGNIDGTSAGKSALRAASDIRGKLDAVLKKDPYIAVADDEFATHMRLKDAMDAGTELFTKGTRLEDFQRSLAAASPQEVDAMRQGARVAIGDALEQARRGTLQGAQSMFGKASANRAKLDALFPQAGGVFDMLHGEAVMRSTEQRVAQNSATAERLAVQRKYTPAHAEGMNPTIPILGESIGGAPLAAGATAAKSIYGHLSNAFTDAARNRLIEGTARGLAASGPEQQNFLSQVGRAYRAQPVTRALTDTSSFATNLLARPLAPPAARNFLSK